MSAWHCRDRALDTAARPLVMGIVNVTPDSFSDGGRFADTQSAYDHARRLMDEGADLIDVGGESSRPGATAVTLDEELRRVLPLVERLGPACPVPISVDTVKAGVARRCLEAGAGVINDISALGDPEMAGVCAAFGAGVVLMHMRGNPQTMQNSPEYGDVVADTAAYLEARLRLASAAGIALGRVAVDPGIGFGKTLDHTLAQLARLGEYGRLGRPILLGVSRKGFLGQVTGRDRANRLAGSLAVAVACAARGEAQILRVHDVAETRDAVLLLGAIRAARPTD